LQTVAADLAQIRDQASGGRSNTDAALSALAGRIGDQAAMLAAIAARPDPAPVVQQQPLQQRPRRATARRGPNGEVEITYHEEGTT
jgi:hypothetical protein